MPELRWGIIGTGNIANTFAEGLKVSRHGRLVAVGSRSQETALKFGTRFGIPPQHCHATYDALLDDPDVDVVYISTPHPQHMQVTIQAAEHGKHALVEKPFAMNEAQVTRMLEAARLHNVFLMEAFMYRCHPQTIKAVRLVLEGAIGDVRLIRARIAFDMRDLGPESRLWRHEMGGGALLDIGVYPMSFARLIAGAALNRPFAEPVRIKGVAHIQPDTKVDEFTIASVEFENAILAQLYAACAYAETDCSVEVIGTKGSFRIPNMWLPGKSSIGPIQIEFTPLGQDTRILPVELEQSNLYAIEADAVANAIFSGEKECHYMSLEDTLGQVRAIDAWRKEIGLSYAEDDQ